MHVVSTTKMLRPKENITFKLAFLFAWCVSTSLVELTGAFTAVSRNPQRFSSSALNQHGFRYLSAGVPNTKFENGGTGRGEYPSVDAKSGTAYPAANARDSPTGHRQTVPNQKGRATTPSPQLFFSSTDPHDLKGRAELQATRAILLRRHNSLEQSQYELRKSHIAQEKAQMDLKEANVQLRLSKSTISSLSDKVVALQQEVLDLRQGQRNSAVVARPNTTAIHNPNDASVESDESRIGDDNDTDALLLEKRMEREEEQYWKGVVEELRNELKNMQAKLDYQNVLIEQHNRKMIPVEEQQRLRIEALSGIADSSLTKGMQLDEPPGGWRFETSCNLNQVSPPEEYDIVADYTQRWSIDSDSSP